MKNKNYITLAKKAADIQINELRKIKKIFNTNFIILKSNFVLIIIT